MVRGARPAAEVQIDIPLVRRLVAAQFPRWASLPIEPVESAGWDNTIFRLGADLAVRLPRRRVSAEHISNEHQWLPALATRSEEHTSELQSRENLVCRLLLEKK